MRSGALGDTLTLMPAIELIKKEVEIILVGRLPGIEILRPYVSQTIDFEMGGWHHLFHDRSDIQINFDLSPPDKIIIFTAMRKRFLMDNIKRLCPESDIFIYPPFPDEKSPFHISWYVADCLSSSGLACDPDVAISQAYSRALLKENTENIKRGDWILIHPGSGSKKKNLPPGFWLELIQRFLPRNVRVLFGPAEEEIFPVFRNALDRKGVGFITFPEISELIRVLAECRLYIGHDSGVTHLSAMLGTKTIALFKSSNPAIWRPLGPNVILMQNEIRQIKMDTLINLITDQDSE